MQRLSALWWDHGLRFPVVAVNGPMQAAAAWDEELAEVLSAPELRVTNYWDCNKVSLLLALHVCNGGVQPCMRLLPHRESMDSSVYESYVQEHSKCIEAKKAIVSSINAKREVMLAPAFCTQDDGSRVPVWLGYVLHTGLATLVTSMLESSRMAIVFDLDETLLVANSQSSISNKIESAQKNRAAKNKELSELNAFSPPEEADRLRSAEAAAAREEELLSSDAEMLRSWAATLTVRVNGREYRHTLESALLEDGTTVMRPVIRLESPPVIFTRIDPAKKETSMIVRTRPGWDELRGFLSGESEAQTLGVRPRQRFEVYVCTAAERSYALEVWRLLDTNATLIPLKDRSKRITNESNGRTKKLLKTLGMGTGRRSRSADEDEAVVSTFETGGVMPLAVIIDDRTDVWETSAQTCLLQVIPWHWYRDEAASQVSGPGSSAHSLAAASDRELLRVRNAVVHLRADVFQDINERVTPVLELATTEGLPEDTSALPGGNSSSSPDRAEVFNINCLPSINSIAAQLKEASRPGSFYAMPTLLSLSLSNAAASASATAASIMASASAPAGMSGLSHTLAATHLDQQQQTGGSTSASGFHATRRSEGTPPPPPVSSSQQTAPSRTAAGKPLHSLKPSDPRKNPKRQTPPITDELSAPSTLFPAAATGQGQMSTTSGPAMLLQPPSAQLMPGPTDPRQMAIGQTAPQQQQQQQQQQAGLQAPSNQASDPRFAMAPSQNGQPALTGPMHPGGFGGAPWLLPGQIPQPPQPPRPPQQQQQQQQNGMPQMMRQQQPGWFGPPQPPMQLQPGQQASMQQSQQPHMQMNIQMLGIFPGPPAPPHGVPLPPHLHNGLPHTHSNPSSSAQTAAVASGGATGPIDPRQQQPLQMPQPPRPPFLPANINNPSLLQPLPLLQPPQPPVAPSQPFSTSLPTLPPPPTTQSQPAPEQGDANGPAGPIQDPHAQLPTFLADIIEQFPDPGVKAFFRNFALQHGSPGISIVLDIIAKANGKPECIAAAVATLFPSGGAPQQNTSPPAALQETSVETDISSQTVVAQQQQQQQQQQQHLPGDPRRMTNLPVLDPIAVGLKPPSFGLINSGPPSQMHMSQQQQQQQQQQLLPQQQQQQQLPQNTLPRPMPLPGPPPTLIPPQPPPWHNATAQQQQQQQQQQQPGPPQNPNFSHSLHLPVDPRAFQPPHQPHQLPMFPQPAPHQFGSNNGQEHQDPRMNNGPPPQHPLLQQQYMQGPPPQQRGSSPSLPLPMPPQPPRQQDGPLQLVQQVDGSYTVVKVSPQDQKTAPLQQPQQLVPPQPPPHLAQPPPQQSAPQAPPQSLIQPPQQTPQVQQQQQEQQQEQQQQQLPPQLQALVALLTSPDQTPEQKAAAILQAREALGMVTGLLHHPTAQQQAATGSLLQPTQTQQPQLSTGEKLDAGLQEAPNSSASHDVKAALTSSNGTNMSAPPPPPPPPPPAQSASEARQERDGKKPSPQGRDNSSGLTAKQEQDTTRHSSRTSQQRTSSPTKKPHSDAKSAPSSSRRDSSAHGRSPERSSHREQASTRGDGNLSSRSTSSHGDRGRDQRMSSTADLHARSPEKKQQRAEEPRSTTAPSAPSLSAQVQDQQRAVPAPGRVSRFGPPEPLRAASDDIIMVDLTSSPSSESQDQKQHDPAQQAPPPPPSLISQPVAASLDETASGAAPRRVSRFAPIAAAAPQPATSATSSASLPTPLSTPPPPPPPAAAAPTATESSQFLVLNMFPTQAGKAAAAAAAAAARAVAQAVAPGPPTSTPLSNVSASGLLSQAAPGSSSVTQPPPGAPVSIAPPRAPAGAPVFMNHARMPWQVPPSGPRPPNGPPPSTFTATIGETPVSTVGAGKRISSDMLAEDGGPNRPAKTNKGATEDSPGGAQQGDDTVSAGEKTAMDAVTAAAGKPSGKPVPGPSPPPLTLQQQQVLQQQAFGLGLGGMAGLGMLGGLPPLGPSPPMNAMGMAGLGGSNPFGGNGAGIMGQLPRFGQGGLGGVAGLFDPLLGGGVSMGMPGLMGASGMNAGMMNAGMMNAGMSGMSSASGLSGSMLQMGQQMNAQLGLPPGHGLGGGGGLPAFPMDPLGLMDPMFLYGLNGTMPMMGNPLLTGSQMGAGSGPSGGMAGSSMGMMGTGGMMNSSSTGNGSVNTMNQTLMPSIMSQQPPRPPTAFPLQMQMQQKHSLMAQQQNQNQIPKAPAPPPPPQPPTAHLTNQQFQALHQQQKLLLGQHQKLQQQGQQQQQLPPPPSMPAPPPGAPPAAPAPSASTIQPLTLDALLDGNLPVRRFQCVGAVAALEMAGQVEKVLIRWQEKRPTRARDGTPWVCLVEWDGKPMGQGADEIKRKAKEAAASAAIDTLIASNSPVSLSMQNSTQYKTYLFKLSQPPGSAPQGPPPAIAPPAAPPGAPPPPGMGATIPGPSPPPNRPPLLPSPPTTEPPQHLQFPMQHPFPGSGVVESVLAASQRVGLNHPVGPARFDHAAHQASTAQFVLQNGVAAMTRVFRTFASAVYYVELPPIKAPTIANGSTKKQARPHARAEVRVKGPNHCAVGRGTTMALAKQNAAIKLLKQLGIPIAPDADPQQQQAPQQPQQLGKRAYQNDEQDEDEEDEGEEGDEHGGYHYRQSEQHEQTSRSSKRHAAESHGGGVATGPKPGKAQPGGPPSGASRYTRNSTRDPHGDGGGGSSPSRPGGSRNPARGQYGSSHGRGAGGEGEDDVEEGGYTEEPAASGMGQGEQAGQLAPSYAFGGRSTGAKGPAVAKRYMSSYLADLGEDLDDGLGMGASRSAGGKGIGSSTVAPASAGTSGKNDGSRVETVHAVAATSSAQAAPRQAAVPTAAVATEHEDSEEEEGELASEEEGMV